VTLCLLVRGTCGRERDSVRSQVHSDTKKPSREMVQASIYRRLVKITSRQPTSMGLPVQYTRPGEGKWSPVLGRVNYGKKKDFIVDNL
jgi:hypothetical protein